MRSHWILCLLKGFNSRPLSLSFGLKLSCTLTDSHVPSKSWTLVHSRSRLASISHAFSMTLILRKELNSRPLLLSFGLHLSCALTDSHVSSKSWTLVHSRSRLASNSHALSLNPMSAQRVELSSTLALVWPQTLTRSHWVTCLLKELNSSPPSFSFGLSLSCALSDSHVSSKSWTLVHSRLSFDLQLLCAVSCILLCPVSCYVQIVPFGLKLSCALTQSHVCTKSWTLVHSRSRLASNSHALSLNLMSAQRVELSSTLALVWPQTLMRSHSISCLHKELNSRPLSLSFGLKLSRALTDSHVSSKSWTLVHSRSRLASVSPALSLTLMSPQRVELSSTLALVWPTTLMCFICILLCPVSCYVLIVPERRDPQHFHYITLASWEWSYFQRNWREEISPDPSKTATLIMVKKGGAYERIQLQWFNLHWKRNGYACYATGLVGGWTYRIFQYYFSRNARSEHPIARFYWRKQCPLRRWRRMVRLQIAFSLLRPRESAVMFKEWATRHQYNELINIDPLKLYHLKHAVSL